MHGSAISLAMQKSCC